MAFREGTNRNNKPRMGCEKIANLFRNRTRSASKVTINLKLILEHLEEDCILI